ncbi:MAG: BlaI/MecI/CopY family transcriptional regulator [Planctomycetes bacterium]|jgi:BlaI family penicillinase repressor|nr:BlaI/MecI/CopY family transcriptional regulator [Planctomycetota bacterium]
MDRSQHLGELQYAIMRVLWEEGESTVARVVERLPRAQRRALTTIATMLTKMEKKGVVDHRAEGRQFIYFPTVSESEVHRTMISDLTERLFQGDAGALVSHLISEQEFDSQELARLKSLIADRQRKEKPHGR